MNIRNLCKITDDLESDKAWEENYTDKIGPSPAEEVSNDDAEVSTEDDDDDYIDFDEDSAWISASPKKMWAPNPYKIRH